MKQLRAALNQELCLLDLNATDLEHIFEQTLDLLVTKQELSNDHQAEVQAALMEREQQVSTAIGHAVAVPHAYLDALEHSLVVFVRLRHPINLGAPDGIATRFLFVLLGPSQSGAVHLDTLTTIARLMSDEDFRYEAGEAHSLEEILAALDHFEERTLPPEKSAEPEVSEGLQYTGKLFGGIINDIKRRAKHYVSDFKDGLHPKCIAAVLFLYFACLAPTITFGGVMAAQTDGQIGAVEMLIAAAVGGVLYAIFSGHPILILGGTGPLLIFTTILYQLCRALGISDHFLLVYTWVGLWMALFLIILAVTDACCLMRFFTRFTDEIFAGLISIIYISEAIRSIVLIFQKVYEPGNENISHDDALVPLILCVGTYFIATSLVRFRKSQYLVPKMREFLADFGPAIAIGVMTLVYVLLHNASEIHVGVLPAPDQIQPTHLEDDGNPRSWFINPTSAPVWIWFASAIPALLGVVLLFLDHNITARILNDSDHHLEKGEAYHWDLLVLSGLTVICSLFGLPWLVAATVRSLNHLRSVATIEDTISPRGEKSSHIIHVRENRITGFAIHLMIGLSLFALPLLKLVPMAVLYGLFLYMGIVSITGNQFFERLALWPMDSARYPQTHYLRRVKRRRVHLYTLIQLACLVVLWLVKSSVLGILFPLFIAVLVPIRLALGYVFTPQELAALDAETEPEEEEVHYL